MEPTNNSNDPVAKARLDVLRQLSGSLAHDMRTPLTVIRNALSILRRSVPQTTDSIESLDMIEVEVLELNSILTTLTEITHGWTPAPVLVDLEPVLSGAIERVDSGHAMKWNIEIRTRPAVVWCDPTQLQQVLYNVCRNAMAAMKGRGEVHIESWQEADHDVIEVRDKGPGISAQVQSTLFEPFVSTKRNGMGLGLTYCREILKRYGGTISLVESSSAGASFRISLPRSTAGNLPS